ncbi:MAG: DUF4861 family protein [Planctomycetota bacterium]
MRTIHCFLLALVLALGTLAGAAHAEDAIHLKVTNPLARSRSGAPVTVSRRALDISADTKVESLRAFKDGAGWDIPFQLDDVDEDGTWDELFFLVDIGPRSTQKVAVTPGDEVPDFPAQSRAMVKGQAEAQGVTNAIWESEMMAYRMYGPLHVDTLGKTVPRLTTEYYFGENGHNIHAFTPGYGQDYLQVNNTMGANSIFIRQPDGDITRPWTSDAYHVETPLPYDSTTRYRVIASGPLRSIIGARITGWSADGGSYECSLRYTITGERRYTTVRYSLDEAPGGTDDLRLGTGFQRFYEDTHHEATDAYVLAVAQHMREAGILNDRVGRAVIPVGDAETEPVHIERDRGMDFAPHNGTNSGLVFPAGKNTVKYAFVMAWEKDDGITSVQQWKEYVSDVAQEVNTPLRVTVQK